MRSLERIRINAKALGSAKRHRGDLFSWLGRRPQILAAVGVYETAVLLSNKLDPTLKDLAELKSAGLVNCEFCLDIGSAIATHSGVTAQQIRDLPVYRDSDAFTELQKLVIAFAEAMTSTPASSETLAELRERLLAQLSRAQVAELATTVAWENQRARLNQSLGVRPTGISDGAACALPE
ncbi:carboxymuconolactone decarboxylase family protein [Gordonia desulfuricans]|uniref:Carboxymuconolactone decarboxylase family protein n=1 Tax=Gordonia desulfuricans TaxID=89051 RepID=A0A7K3LJ87_9ACTN|nr:MULTISPECIES: carboxymuconolactone decarboxylase family protein [Gordonia]EMP12813.2 alkylhydroperoxidase [Gordonia sp. NB41Y]NDK88233.1 carboxymuconolactone decarboxylase family protein [Gordonia desulfuricans]WLP89235.1 carboxymuconolactone decarboxylase family protein [Gordonia sp. NB41Y]